MKKNEEKTEKLREIGVGCLLSSTVGKFKNLKGKGGESSNAKTFRRVKDLLIFLLKLIGAQRPRIDLNKSFLPRPNTTTA